MKVCNHEVEQIRTEAGVTLWDGPDVRIVTACGSFENQFPLIWSKIFPKDKFPDWLEAGDRYFGLVHSRNSYRNNEI